MKLDPNLAVLPIADSIRKFLRETTPAEANRLLQEHAGLVPLAHVLELESQLSEESDLEDKASKFEIQAEETAETLQCLAERIRDVVASRLLHPTDLHTCSPRNICHELATILEKDFSADLKGKITPLPTFPDGAIGIDPEYPESWPPEMQAAASERSDSPAAPAPAPTPAPPAAATKPAKQTREAGLAIGPPVMTRNPEKNGIELRFNGKPDDSTRDAMKAHGFRWLPRQPGQPWAAKYTEERLIFALQLSGQDLPAAEPEIQAAPPAVTPSERSDTPAPISGFSLPDWMK